MNDKLISREFVESQLREFGVPGMGIGVVRDGKVLMSEGFGYRDREKQLPVTPQTLFGIASWSMAFGAPLP
jgi:Beta-lactamase class C and other penicillin binding proteins